MKSLRTFTFRSAAFSLAAVIGLGTCGFAQDTAGPPNPASTDAAIRDLQDQVRQLRSLVDEMRSENAESRAEMHQLRQDLQTTRALLEKTGAPAEAVAQAEPANESQPAAGAPAQPATPLEDRVQKLEDSTSLLNSKVDEQYQTKVETASKYRARLHGIILMNAFHNIGASDSIDVPNVAIPVSPGSPEATLGATLRQSQIGLEIFGPTVAGARTSADIQMDFAGGFPSIGNGVNFGIVRLQTASLRFDWEHTSVVAGQDSLFLSPLSPTSFASLATPAFAFSGNLWGWTPQIRVEHSFSLTDQQTITMQAGLLDNLDWQYPQNQYFRSPQAGELSGQPGYGFRTAWSRPVNGHPLSFGVAGYFGRQDWTWDRYVDAWAGMADWQIPIISRLSLSGEFYRGRGIGGLGGGIGTSIVYGGNPTLGSSPIRPVDAAGGWTQLKLQLTPKIELNGAISQDNAFTSNIRGFAFDVNNFGEIVGRNRGAMGNIVYRPRSDLILSAELRRIRTFPIYSSSSVVNQASASLGILF